MEKIRLFYYNNRRWFYTLQFIGYSMILLLLVSAIDLRFLPIQEQLPEILLTKVSLAKSILTTLAGALLTITTFTFSTILAVMTMYASNYTPRVVENFVNMKITMQVLGIFVGGFFYCISMLVFMRDRFEDEQVVAGVVAVIYSVIGIIYFVVFVQSVLSKFQGVNLIFDIAEESEDVVNTEFKDRSETAEYVREDDSERVPIYSVKDGYLSVIDYERLSKLLEEHEGVFVIMEQLGNYVIKGQEIGYINLCGGFAEKFCSLADLAKAAQIDELKSLDPERELSEAEEAQLEKCKKAKEFLQALAECFFMQDRKLSSKDYRYNLLKLEEIALRALSPGINDPNTAIHVIRKLGVIMAPLATTDYYHIAKRDATGCQIFYTSYQFKDDLYAFYSRLVHYGKGDILVLLAIFNSLKIMKVGATSKQSAVIDEFADYVLEAGQGSLELKLDKEKLEEGYEKLCENRARIY
ncbi:MAG: DUF2254 family protein [Eubacteriales bacterium]|nr:DUF2254 family protein [Eubacteriales bacterium]